MIYGIEEWIFLFRIVQSSYLVGATVRCWLKSIKLLNRVFFSSVLIFSQTWLLWISLLICSLVVLQLLSGTYPKKNPMWSKFMPCSSGISLFFPYLQFPLFPVPRWFTEDNTISERHVPQCSSSQIFHKHFQHQIDDNDSNSYHWIATVWIEKLQLESLLNWNFKKFSSYHQNW